jgi:hypothetical protein
MDKKTLNAKAVNIKGKAYVLVADRVNFFNENYPKGSIETELVSATTESRVIVKATVYPEGCAEDARHFNGYSQAVVGEGYINKTSALENAETSAVGRALALMGIGVIDSIASVDELNKTTYPQTIQVGAKIPEHDNHKPLNWEGDNGGIDVASLNSKGYKGGVGTRRTQIGRSLPMPSGLSDEDVRKINEGL